MKTIVRRSLIQKPLLPRPGSVNFFSKGPNIKYFRFAGYTVSVAYCLLLVKVAQDNI